MQMRFGMLVGAALAMKHHEDLAEHVERGHARSDQTDAPKNKRAVAERLPENQIFGEKTGGERNAGERQASRRRRSNRSAAYAP